MPYGTIDQKIEKEHKICSLVDEFKKVVDRVGRKIIDEIHTPVMYKTYKPLDAGGVAGTLLLYMIYWRDNLIQIRRPKVRC